MDFIKSIDVGGFSAPADGAVPTLAATPAPIRGRGVSAAGRTSDTDLTLGDPSTFVEAPPP